MIVSNTILITKGGTQMGFLAIFKDAFGIKAEDNIKIGLSRFNLADNAEEPVTKPEISIRNKAVKLSDLMRKSNSY